MTENKIKFFSLYSAFFKIGLFTFGGGYAMLPMLEKECVDKHKWISSEDLLDYFAVSQCTPGIIAVNTATFIGYKHRGVAGAVFATLGIISPSFIIILLSASVLQVFQNNIFVLQAFSGIRIVVCALILKTVVNVSKNSLKNIKTIIIAVLAFLSQFFGLCSPSLSVIFTLFFGFLFYRFSGNRIGGKK